MIGSDDNGTCECQGCSCPTDYVAINRTCMPDVSMLLVCATCVCEWHVCFCIYVCVCVGGGGGGGGKRSMHIDLHLLM